MKRAEAQKALDEAAAAGIKGMFAALIINTQEGDKSAVNKFRSGVTNHILALSVASQVISEKFEE